MTTERKMQGDAPSGSDPDPYGDDQGTRVGRPSTPHRDNMESGKKGARGEQAKATGAGNGAAEGIHDANAGGSGTRPGSEPLKERDAVHKPGYGGEGGKPRTSSDQR